MKRLALALSLLLALAVTLVLVTRDDAPAPAAPLSATAPAATSSTPRPELRAESRLVARDPAEWQGMRLSLDEPRAACDVSERCGLAAACVGGKCGGCTADSECAGGEACVLDHCVKAELVSCRSRSECGAEELCVLSGISEDARGNSDMRAYCQGRTVDVAQTREAHAAKQRARVGIPAPPREVTPHKLLDGL